MIFSKIFGKKGKTNPEEYASLQSEYASLQTENIVQELNLSDQAQTKNYVVDLCEQMIDASRDLEEAKDEYDLVTNYLMDVQLIEDLEGDTKKEIVDCATEVAELESRRTNFLKMDKKLSDTQYAQMQDEEENLPRTISRLQENEKDLDAIKKDMSYLE
ncbi:MAG: hypothetical protein PUF65_09840, partial [Lachnospiraceae bacterium]|nr:hypothetical protein [Lachnospiraceae bacterium]